MFDVINSSGEKERDYLIHARLAHLPRKAILQMIKNGAKGLPYKGKFKELCRPCLEARQKAENQGKAKVRHPEGKIGEHLHSDLAVVNLQDFSGFKYVLTVVNEISDEVIITLLKTKEAEKVLESCKKTLKMISARNGNIKLKTWQFDRGGEFLNDLFEEWIVRTLGAKQLLSNVEHPWENGRAERSFATIFSKARAMLKYADLPNGLWGKAVTHSVFLKNRCPSSRLNFLAPIQFRTGEIIDFTRLRVFGCPAQIFVKQKDRSNNKISSRSEKGTFIGMSKLGNGFLFRIERTKSFVEVDSADVKFNETFSDCRDRKGKIIKGGRVLDPELFNVPEMEANISAMLSKLNDKDERSRFSARNFYSDLAPDESEESDSDREVPAQRKNYQKTTKKDDSDSEPIKKPFDDSLKRDETKEPIKKRQTKMRDLESIKPSFGFESSFKNSSSTINSNQSESRRKSERKKSAIKSNESESRRRSERNTSTRVGNEPSLMTSDDNDDMTELDPTIQNLDQLMSCLEQNVKAESGKLNNINEDDILKSLQEIGSPDPKSQAAINKMPKQKRKRYNDATMKEYEGMKKKDVMEFVRKSDVPNDARIYICIVNWVTKFVLGKYQKTKCRICFGGHHYVKTFTDCFAPTVNFCSVLIMLCLAAMFGWHLGSLDYSQAYLNAEIDEECYLRAPEFLREYDKDGTEFIWKLKKVIYGHPKGSRLWAECLTNKLKALGYSQLKTDQCVYAKWNKWDLQNLKSDSHFVFILVHSDDLIIISNKKEIMLQEKKLLLEAFEGVDQGSLSSFCGVEINIDENGIALSMAYYWNKVLKRFGILDNDKQDKPIKTKVNRNDCPTIVNEERKKTYLQMIGSIIFGFTHCRLDLALAIGMLTRVMHNPSEGHLKQLYGLLRYVNATKEWGLKYYRDYSMTYGMKLIFLAFCDSSHGDDEATFRSTGGWNFFLRKNQGCVSAKSGQTPDVALSSTEAETIWACGAATQGAFIKQFLDELNIFGETSFEIMEDSQPAINAQRKNVSQSKFRHIKIKYHYLRQLISEGWCKLVKIGTKDQVADLATKILNTSTTEYFSSIILGKYIDQSLYANVDLMHVTVDQSLHVYYDTTEYYLLPYNDWGVMSTPNSVVVLNDNIVVLSS
jgi:transposase InsO family protein